MSLGLPFRLARLNVNRALARASHVAAVVCLSSACVLIAAAQGALADRAVWPALIALAIMLTSLWVMIARPSTLTTAGYLSIGGVCTYWCALVMLSQPSLTAIGGTLFLILPKVALVLIGGSGVGMSTALIWCSAGYVTAELAVIVAMIQTGGFIRFAPATLIAYLIIVFVLSIVWVAQRRVRLAQPNVDQAEKDEQLAATRYRIELSASALMHDTVLNHLAAIAGSSSDALNPELAQQMERDVEILTSEEWLVGRPPVDDERTSVDWQQGELSRVVREARRQGLKVEVTGDVTVVSRLSPQVSAAVTLAVKQCLINVVKHAGTDRAEVAVYGSADDVSVMVIDAGRGFAQKDVASDRLGIRNSVRGRIGSVGGTVQLWSTPGRGTSIMIRVPILEPDQVEPLPGLADHG